MADGDKVGGVYLEIGSEVAKGTPEDSIKKIRAAVKKAADVKLSIALDSLTKTQVNAARKAAQEVADTAREIQLPVALKKLSRSAATAGRKLAQEVVDSGKEVHLPVDLRKMTKKAAAAGRKVAQEVIDSGKAVQLPVGAKGGAKLKRQVDKIVDDIEDHEADLPVVTDLQATITRAALAHLTRPRTVDIIPKMNAKATAAVAGALLALSGGRAISDRISSLSTSLMNLDRSIPSIAGISTAIANIGSGAMAGISNLLTIGGGLASIASVGLALPGIFAGFGVGLGVMVAALKDAGDVLGDLGPQFSALQDTISDNFWAEFEGPIRNLVGTWMPSLESGFAGISTELGIFGASMANALSSADNVGHLDSILESVRESIDIAGEGIAHFADAMMGLVDVGASYLPDLAGWFNRISEDFSAWIEEATESGEIFEWIDTGIQALKDLGRVVWGIGGVFSNLGTAAAAAGGSTLGGLADGLEDLNAAMEGPAFQGAMTTVFQGAHDAMAALGPGVGALGDAFVAFAPTLAEIMTLAGEVGSVGLGAIASAFENPAFQGGLTDFFEGVLSGVEAVAPHIPALATAFGSVASFAGTLASVLGPVLGAAIEALAPVVTSLMEGLEPVAQVLGDVLVGAIETVGPLIQDLVGTIMEWVGENPGLVATIGAVVAVLGGLIAGAIGVVTALLPVIGTIVGIVTAIMGAGGLSAVLAAASAAFSGLMAAIGPVLAVIAIVAAGVIALGAALVYAWQTSEPFRQAVIGLGEALMAFLQPIIDFIVTTVVPVVVQVAQAFMSMVQQIVDALIPMWTTMMEIWTAILAILTPVVEFILSVFAPIFTHLGTIVSAAFTFIGTVISTVINVITAILQVFLAILQGDWSAAWEAVKNVVAVVWQGIQDVIGAAITFVWTIIQSVLSTIQGVWNAIWGAISSFALSIFSRIVSAAVSFINNVRSFISNGINTVRTIWNSVWNAIVSFALSVFARIVSSVVGMVGNVKSNVQSGFNAAKDMAVNAFQRLKDGVIEKGKAVVSWVKDLPSKIKSALGNLGSLLLGAGKDLMNGLKEGINSAWEGVKTRLSNITDMIPNWKGPPQRDAVLLVDAGRSVMEGFEDGLVDSIPSVRRTLESLTGSLPRTMELSAGSVPVAPVRRPQQVSASADSDVIGPAVAQALSGMSVTFKAGRSEIRGVMEYGAGPRGRIVVEGV